MLIPDVDVFRTIMQGLVVHEDHGGVVVAIEDRGIGDGDGETTDQHP